jgi:signal transduction histidine kinase
MLILLPVLVLAAIGFASIQQDRSLAQREAAEHAQSLADESAEALWAALSDTSRLGRELAFQVDGAGQLVFPPRVAAVPQPRPFPLHELTSEQSRLWAGMSQPLADSTNAASTLREFLASHPPERFDAAARFQLARLLAAGGDAGSARALFADVVRRSPAALGETGLPLAPLARLKRIELADPTDHLRAAELLALRSGALSNPSPVTPYLLDRAAGLDGVSPAADPWRAEWERQEMLRELHAKATTQWRRDNGSNATREFPRFFWFATDRPASANNPASRPGAIRWLATRAETNATGAWFICRPALDERISLPASGPLDGSPRFGFDPFWEHLNMIRSFVLTNGAADPLPAAVQSARKRLPTYFGLSLNIAGHALISSNDLPSLVRALGSKGSKGGRQFWSASPGAAPPALLAFSRRFDEGAEAFRVGVHLIGPELLYERQRSRSLRFGLLIVASAVAAFAGFIAARRAFLRTQQLSEMKSNFVSSVSHELRAPIASVRLMAENLQRGKIPDAGKQHDYFRFIVQECRRLSSLIENVLDFARIEQGRKQYDLEPTDVVALVQQTVKLMEPAAAEKKVTLHLDGVPRSAGLPLGANDGVAAEQRAEQGLGAPLLDAPAIQQALVNLLDNAIKHSPNAATVTIAASLNPQLSTLNLSVADTGPGIPREEHEKIFERFYRRGSELRRETPGVGIGLSIVKHIAEAHGGRVVVESQPGKGSRFTIELPCAFEGEVQSSKFKVQGKLK